jgi:hypothetical protein
LIIGQSHRAIVLSWLNYRQTARQIGIEIDYNGLPDEMIYDLEHYLRTVSSRPEFLRIVRRLALELRPQSLSSSFG